MRQENYKMYVDKSFTCHSSFESAKEEAKKYISDEPYLRIECLAGEEEGSWWAYEYSNGKWARS